MCAVINLLTCVTSGDTVTVGDREDTHFTPQVCVALVCARPIDAIFRRPKHKLQHSSTQTQSLLFILAKKFLACCGHVRFAFISEIENAGGCVWADAAHGAAERGPASIPAHQRNVLRPHSDHLPGLSRLQIVQI